MKPFFDSRLPRGGDHVLRGPVAIVVGIGIFVSVAIAQAFQAIESRRELADFQLAAEQTINDMEGRVDNQIELIRSIVSLFNSSSVVDRGEFQSFVADSLGRHPSIQLVGWAPRVSDGERQKFEASARSEGLTNYQINERNAERQAIPAGIRPEYFPNFYLEPPPAQPATYGLDQGSEPARRSALDLARDTGELIFSERIDLALVAENRTAILAYAPIYSGNRKPATVEQRRQQLSGYAYGVVRPSMIVDVMIAERARYVDRLARPGMRIDVYDTTNPEESRFLFFYRSSRDTSKADEQDTIVTGKNDFVSTATFGGRQWTFVARPTSGTLSGTVSWQTGLAFATSLFLSLLLGAYLHAVLNRSQAIETEVSLRTNELRLTNELLRNSEDRIRVITDSVPALIAYVDRDLVYRFANRGYWKIGIDPDSMIGKTMREVRGDESYEKVRHHFERAARGEPVSFETTGTGIDGVERTFTIECTPDVANGEVRGFYVLARDVSEQLAAQNELKRAYELLRESDDRIRTIANSVPALIAYLDSDLIYRFANERYRDIGIDPEQLIGAPLENRRKDGSYETIKPYFERAAKGEAVSFEITPIEKNGEKRYRQISCTPDIVNGKVRGFYLLGRDITDQRRAENEIKRTYELLRNSEERLRIITNSLPALISYVDRDMKIRYANERFSLLGINLDNPVGESLQQFIGPQRFDNFEVASRRALLGEATQLEISLDTPDGRDLAILADFTPEFAANGDVDGFYFVALNVTAQRALEIELDRFFRQSPSFMCVATFDGFLRRFNDTWTTALGYSTDELITTPYQNFIHSDDKAKVEAAFERLRTGGELANLEIRLVHKDGTERFVLLTAAANQSERQIYATGHDITDLKAIDRMKDEFVSTVSHELRTPLTSIKGALGLMRAKTLGTLPRDLNTMLEIADKNCDRLILLINDILDIEKIEAGKMDIRFEPIDIVSTVRNAIAANQSYADQFNVKIVLDGGIQSAKIRGDEGRMMQVMANLLSNASKFSHENSEVHTRVERMGRMIRVSVRDSGQGIPDEFRNRIFEKFSQSDASDRRKISGTGLGLSIVRAIVERHGGHVDFESTLGKGSTFYFDIPELDEDYEIAAVPQRAPTILICESNSAVSAILRRAVERCGYSAEIATSAAGAKSLLNLNSYAGMTLDTVLADMNGIDLLKHLRSSPHTRSLPVIFVAGKVPHDGESMAAGSVEIVDWLDKPLDESRLAETIRSAIAASERTRRRLLHIEDDHDIVQIVASLVGPDITVVSAGSLAAARELLGKERFDLAILDLLLPDGRGEDLLLNMVNPDGSHIPVIVFSALEAPTDVATRVQAALVKTRSTEKMLAEAIDAFVNRHNLASSTPYSPDARNEAHG